MNFVITGTSRGVGLELARQSLERGYTVHAIAREPSRSSGLEALRARHGAKLKLYRADVTSDRDIESFVRELGRETPVDVLINNAGILPGYEPKLEGVELSDVVDAFATNVLGPMRVAKALLPNFAKASRPKVANITSLMGSIGDNSGGRAYAYRISKAALNMFTKTLAVDYPGITVLSIHPGWVRTDMGGPGAPTLPEEAARGILDVIERAKSGDSGRFRDFEGDELPW